MTTPHGLESESRFHTTDAKYRQYTASAMQKAIESKKITEDDADLIRKFLRESKATGKKKISDARCFKIVLSLIAIRHFFPEPFRQCSIDNVYDAIEKIKNVRKPDGSTPYKDNTVADYIRFMKRFFRWMVENGHSTIPDKKLMGISPPAYRYDMKTADDIFTKEEIRDMLNACQNSRDRAIVATTYDGACRIGEIGTLRWNQVEFTDVNATIKVRFKTEKIRLIPLFMAKEYLIAWRNDYPGDPSGENYVFLTSGGGRSRKGRHQLQYAGIAKQIKIIAARAGIKRHVTPHIFRHSKITHLVRDRMQESMIKKIGWGTLTTTMLEKCYAHVEDEDVLNEAARIANVQIDDKPKSTVLEPRQCPHCGTVAAPTQTWCPACGTALTGEARDKLKSATEQAETLPWFKEIETKWQKQLEDMQNQIIQLQKGKGSA
jgi:integrase